MGITEIVCRLCLRRIGYTDRPNPPRDICLECVYSGRWAKGL